MGNTNSIEKIVDQLIIEQANLGEIHLVLRKDFWSAMEKSAFLLERFLWPGLTVMIGENKSFAQYTRVGFPQQKLEEVLAKAREQGNKIFCAPKEGEECTYVRLSSANYQVRGFEAWKKKKLSVRERIRRALKPPCGNFPVYRSFFSLSLLTLQCVRGFSVELRSLLGQQMLTCLREMHSDFEEVLRDGCPNKIEKIDVLLDKLEVFCYWWRLAMESRAVSDTIIAELILHQGEIRNQLTLWKIKLQTQNSGLAAKK